MRAYLVLSLVLFLYCCGNSPGLHVADLPTFEGEARTLQGSTCKEAEDHCFSCSGARLCYKSTRLNSRLAMRVETPLGTYKAEKFGGSVTDIFKRLLSSPARILNVYSYGDGTFGIQHTYGYTIFYRDRFCTSFRSSPNGLLEFGVDDSGNPLFKAESPFNPDRAPVHPDDRFFEGWRYFSLSAHCD